MADTKKNALEELAKRLDIIAFGLVTDGHPCDETIDIRKAQRIVAELAKVKEQKRQSIEKHNTVADAMHKYITCATHRNEKRDCNPWDCPKCQSYVKVDS